MNTPLSLRARALNLLARREMSRLELQRKLAPHAESAEALEQVLNELAERHWQSDERFTEMWIHSKGQKHGRLRLQHELVAKGVERELIQQHLPDANDEQQHAILVLRKKFKHAATTPQDKQKQMRFLAYRGFEMDTIHRALAQAWQND